MNRLLSAVLPMILCAMSAAAFAASGEYWEITSKMEMPGMPFAMPATTQKVCLAKGGENDPRTASGDKSCQMTDVRTVGNKTTWKAHCDRNGEVMNGSGEQTTTSSGYTGNMHLTGVSHGRDMNMTMAFSGKRIGGSCDSEEAANQYKQQARSAAAAAGAQRRMGEGREHGARLRERDAVARQGASADDGEVASSGNSAPASQQSAQAGSPAADVLDNAKKLKGLLGF